MKKPLVLLRAAAWISADLSDIKFTVIALINSSSTGVGGRFQGQARQVPRLLPLVLLPKRSISESV